VRIVSLVPSLTELIIDLGLEKELVGRTKFCIHPKDKVKSIPKIGGTKEVSISKVSSLKPDLIIANKEENTKKDVEALHNITNVYVTDISNYSEALLAIQQIGKFANRIKESTFLINRIKDSFSRLSGLSQNRKSVCYLIWKNPLMTVGHDNFIHDMLHRCGFENVFGGRDRYPTISNADIESKNPEYIFLSSEPFPFKDKHIQEFSLLFPNSKIVLVDGEYFSWYGSRMVSAADYFIDLITRLNKG